MVVIIVWLELYGQALLSGALYNALGLLQGDTETSQVSIWAEAEEAALDFEPFPGSGSMPWSLRGHLCATRRQQMFLCIRRGQLGMSS
ncbi:unnamed protein product [Boreogadus saida]